jgi:hypothetical protein
MNVDEDLDKLLDNLPFFIQENLYNHPNKDKLIEVVMDLGPALKHVLRQVLNSYHRKLFHGKILTIQRNGLVSLVMIIVQALNEHYIESVACEIDNF